MMTDGSGATDLIVQGACSVIAFRKSRHNKPAHGGHIFDFTRNRVPPLIADLLALSGKTPRDYAYFIFHQANEYLIKFLASRPASVLVVPFSLAQFGNTGQRLFPLTLALAELPTVGGCV
jgi:3-oxoacyl-[acyl-carrier-protein] synthase-3